MMAISAILTFLTSGLTTRKRTEEETPLEVEATRLGVRALTVLVLMVTASVLGLGSPLIVELLRQW
jgi:hypothetical protein